MNKHILITGATGMIGRRLVHDLLKSNHTVAILSREQHNMPRVKSYLWNVARNQIDPKCMEGVDTIIHLAGENIAEQKWTNERKKQIIDSRVQSAGLLYKNIKETNANVSSFISASAVGYYGDCGDQILTEDDPPGAGFMAECCKLWEAAADQGLSLGIRVVKLRTGVVLAKNKGALASLEKPIKLFAGAPLGTGKQWVPWVHIDDVIASYIHAVENTQVSGAYNVCAPFPVTNATLTKTIAGKLHRPVWPFSIPELALKIALGEMSKVVLMSTNTSAQKLLSTDFKFKYTQLQDALSDIYG